MTAAGLVCGACGAELPPNSKFCNQCGLALAASAEPAEHKQVMALFADVVHSMDIAAGSPANRFTELQSAHSADDLGEWETGRQSSAQAGLHRAGIDQHRIAQAVVTPYGGLIDDVIGGSSQKVFFQ
jgi:hypothetical protein